jgi:hypothetical protein
MRPAWLKLLLLNNQRIRFGLTFPFLVGALREPPGAATDTNVAEGELKRLLVSMRDETPESYAIRISECDRLHQPVAAQIPGVYSAGVGFAAIPSPTNGRVSLYVSEQYLLGAPRGIDAVSNPLWTMSATAISERHFSFHDGSFHGFDDRDLGFIREALAMADEDEA